MFQKKAPGVKEPAFTASKAAKPPVTKAPKAFNKAEVQAKIAALRKPRAAPEPDGDEPSGY